MAKQHPTGFEYWGCANRIVNGRAVCDSHHINEDVLYATYHAAVEAMIEDAGVLLEVIQTETEMEMQPGNKAAMDEVEQQIIELQERVLDLHKQKRAMKISDAYYNAQVNDYSQQLGALESRQQALQTADARYATVRMWLADFRQHMQEGDATDDRDGSIMKTLVQTTAGTSSSKRLSDEYPATLKGRRRNRPYWLEILHSTKYIDERSYKTLSAKCTSLRVMLIASCKTAKENVK